MDESVLYLGESIGLDEPNTSKTVQCPMLLNGYPFNEKFIVYRTHHRDSKWPVHQAIQYHRILDGFPCRKYYIVVL